MNGDPGSAAETAQDAQVEALLVFVRETRGFDFTGYKRTTLRRRLAKRMRDAGVDDVSSYRDRLETDPGEFAALFDTVLINVTSFLRDPECWEYLREQAIPEIVARSDRREGAIRVWAAGCAAGQEAYSLAMSFTHLLGERDFDRRVKIYGTDVDEAALTEARAGVYTAEQLAGVPAEWQERFFTAHGDGFAVSRDLRRRVIFGRHDLTADAPISRLDLITCRNTLMYFNAEAQSLILDRLHFGLSPEGMLFLGRAEMLLTGHQFTPVSVRARIFKRHPNESAGAVPGRAAAVGAAIEAADLLRLQSGVVDSAPDATVVIGADGAVVLANRAAHSVLGLSDQDIGRPFGHLPLAFRSAPLRAAVERAAADGPADLTGITIIDPGDSERVFDIAVRPLRGEADDLGAVVTFVDVTAARRLAEELKRHQVELEGTQEQLRTANTELEAANEELQSMNEELETTNEELQSTNEELETTNEELQSTNEELETMNEEIRLRGAEADEYSAYLHGVLASMSAAVAVLDGQTRVRFWNKGAEQMWGLRSGEVTGEPFFGLDFGLPTDGLRELVAGGLRGQRIGSELVQVEAINRLGRTLRCAVRATALEGEGHGVVLVIEEAPPAPAARAPR